nr:DUF2332 family protein [Sinomonas humi]
MPEVVSRSGVDLNPLDAGDPSQVEWLEALVWPEHEARRTRLSAAVAIAAAEPPTLLGGDLLETIPSLVGQAPRGSRIVVFHSAVLGLPRPRPSLTVCRAHALHAGRDVD